MSQRFLGLKVLVFAGLVAVCVSGSKANTIIDLVSVGDSGNAGDSRYGGYGSVGYTYKIGKYEVTAGQYTAFLNSVATTDTYGLYNTDMWLPGYGCKIQRNGSSGSYSYSVASGYANRPVNLVSFWDSCRFANWMHNGQPIGPQGAGTTETGAYTLTTDGMNNNTITRNGNWKWAVTSEDEWYKAAYYKGGSTNAGYWDYPTSSNTEPGRDMADASGNNANSFGLPYPIDASYYTTMAGEFQNSESPYGTFDQGGNVWEWNEVITWFGSNRGMRGGSFYIDGSAQRATERYSADPANESNFMGFRLVEVPEPATMALLLLAGVGIIRRRKA